METNENKRIIEVKGVKMEIDLRHAKRIDEFKVGDTIKVLKKQWNEGWKSHLGTIAGFDDFKNLPTIIIAYLDGPRLEFCYFNAESKDVEICGAYDTDLTYTKGDILTAMDRDIETKRREIAGMEEKKEYFIRNFGRYFEPEEESETA